jgi:hypothetical protein
MLRSGLPSYAARCFTPNLASFTLAEPWADLWVGCHEVAPAVNFRAPSIVNQTVATSAELPRGYRISDDHYRFRDRPRAPF